jgi:hypothetical protein
MGFGTSRRNRSATGMLTSRHISLDSSALRLPLERGSRVDLPSGAGSKAHRFWFAKKRMIWMMAATRTVWRDLNLGIDSKRWLCGRS